MSKQIANNTPLNHILSNQITNNYETVSNAILRYIELSKTKMILPERLEKKLTPNFGLSRCLYSIEEINFILKYMERKRILVKENYGVVHACPNCNTILKKAMCNCNSKNITKKQKILHPKCGHIGDSDHFLTEIGIQCPSCGDIFNERRDSRKNADYRFVDSKFVCEDCGDEYTSFKLMGLSHCVECNSIVEDAHSKIYNLDIYKKRQAEHHLRINLD